MERDEEEEEEKEVRKRKRKREMRKEWQSSCSLEADEKKLYGIDRVCVSLII